MICTAAVAIAVLGQSAFTAIPNSYLAIPRTHILIVITIVYATVPENHLDSMSRVAQDLKYVDY